MKTNEQALELLQKVTGIEYSDEQRDILLSDGGLRILACAGSGKTTLLAHFIAKKILTEEITDTSKLLCTTYSKEGASELESRLNTLLNQLGILNKKVQVSTIHAFYYRLLHKFGYAFSVCLTRQTYITRAVRELQLKLTDDAIAGLDSIMSYQVNNMLTTKELYRHPIFNIDITEDQFSQVCRLFTQYKNAAHEIDFDDMQLLIYQKLCTVNYDKEMLKYCREHWTHYFIDEFQDVSRLQYRIFREIISEPDNLVIIGDDDQSIYSWRGADPNIILDICADYNLQSYPLNTNYRCGGEIVRRAAVQIQNNTVRAKKAIKGSSEDGIIRLCFSDNGIYGKSKQAYNYIINKIESGASPADIAVIARNNMHLSILNSLLFRSSIFANIRDEMKISSSYLYKDMKDIIELAKDCYNYGIAEGLLWKLIPYLSINNSRLVGEVMKSAGLDLIDAICYILHNYSFRYKGRMHPSERVLEKPINSKLGRRINGAFSDSGETALYNLYNILIKGEKEEKVKKLMNLYVNASAFLYASRDKQRILAAYAAYMQDLIQDDYDVGLSYLNLQEQYEQGDITGTQADKITLTTAHSAKGKEWKYVILLCDDNISFPALDSFGALLSKDRAYAYRTLDEERRLHYVAMTRAKEELIVLADKHNPSVFLYEAYGAASGDKLIEQYVTARQNNDIRTLEALRQNGKGTFSEAGWIDLSADITLHKRELDEEDITDTEPSTVLDLL